MSAVRVSGGGWVRSDIIVSVFADDEGYSDTRGYPVKLRCQPNPFVRHPVVEWKPTREAAQRAADELAELLWSPT